ncbi:MAG TPA: glycosyltransferase family A protein [Verrucomicrobiae bacterium]|jgi:glycosyltransferase involved in cell wall biosynthesis
MINATYVIVTPVRNEIEHLKRTIESVTAQTWLPREWVVVNDGSTDGTAELIDEMARKHSWIRGVHRPDRGFRKSGGGVMEAFYDGFSRISDAGWDYVVKLDGDLSFAADYFEKCHERFLADPKLAIGGGTVCSLASGGTEPEAQGDPPFHVRGAVKMYRRECWQQMGGLYKATGWDTLDEAKANMLGWSTYTFDELKLTHYRFAGDADGSWKNWVKNGLANYITGYHPLFMLVKCASRVFKKPYFLAAAGLGFGFASGYFKRIPPVDDSNLIKYFRDQQLRRLTLRDSLWSRR